MMEGSVADGSLAQAVAFISNPQYKMQAYLPFFVLPPPFLCAASILGHTGLPWRGRCLCVDPAWQGLAPSRELLDVTDSPLKVVANMLATSCVSSYRTLGDL